MNINTGIYSRDYTVILTIKHGIRNHDPFNSTKHANNSGVRTNHRSIIDDTVIRAFQPVLTASRTLSRMRETEKARNRTRELGRSVEQE